LINKAALMKIGVYDSFNYFTNFEDYDYCKRLRKKGGKIFLIPRAQYFHPDLDVKYSIKASKLKLYIKRKFLLPCLPPRLGIVSNSMSNREYYSQYSQSYMYIKYTNIIQLMCILIFSMILLVKKKILEKDIMFLKTIKINLTVFHRIRINRDKIDTFLKY